AKLFTQKIPSQPCLRCHQPLNLAARKSTFKNHLSSAVNSATRQDHRKQPFFDLSVAPRSTSSIPDNQPLISKSPLPAQPGSAITKHYRRRPSHPQPRESNRSTDSLASSACNRTCTSRCPSHASRPNLAKLHLRPPTATTQDAELPLSLEPAQAITLNSATSVY
ncbi:hypothetical protein TorRG33x02_091050, partial [Trema orientale]